MKSVSSDMTATPLKISFNIQTQEGAYGGGNQFANYLDNFLSTQGHTVVRDLRHDLDLILIVSSKFNETTTAYSIQEIESYIEINPNTIVVLRVNTCDEQRGVESGYNKAVLDASRLANQIIHVSHFTHDLFAGHGLDSEIPSSVIYTGADESVFFPEGSAIWTPDQKMKVITHHWSPSYLKGTDIYERFAQMLDYFSYRERFEFTYLGTLPYGIELPNTKRLSVREPNEIGDILRQHHVYLSAARAEPAGNHYIEGMRCGLPVLYLNHGSLPEYCASFGVEFNLANFAEKLDEIYDRYDDIRQLMSTCPYAGHNMAIQYEKLFIALVSERRSNPLANPSLTAKKKYIFRKIRRTLGNMRRSAF